MQEDKFELLARGSNTELVLYEQIVLKMVDVQYPKHARHLHNQHAILKTLDHPNVIVGLGLRRNVKFACERLGIEGARDVLLLEHATEGSLLHYLKKNRLSGTAKHSLLGQLCEALYYLHITERVAHRDIKLDNLLVTKNSKDEVKLLLSDFGFAVRGDPDKPDLQAHSCKGTRRGYMPPELHLLNEESPAYEATKLDIFSFGVVIFALMFGKLPFEFATTNDKHYGLLAENKYDEFWLKHNISEEAWSRVGLKDQLRQMLQDMWQFLPANRPTIDQVRQSPWFTYSFK